MGDEVQDRSLLYSSRSMRSNAECRTGLKSSRYFFLFVDSKCLRSRYKAFCETKPVILSIFLCCIFHNVEFLFLFKWKRRDQHNNAFFFLNELSRSLRVMARWSKPKRRNFLGDRSSGKPFPLFSFLFVVVSFFLFSFTQPIMMIEALLFTKEYRRKMMRDF